MATFEEMFRTIETGANDAQKAATKLSSTVKQLQKAAKGGSINDIRKATKQINESLETLRRGAKQLEWPLKDEENLARMEQSFADELIREAGNIGLDIHKHGGRLIALLLTIQLLPKESAIKINNKKTLNIRPSKLAGDLLANSKKKRTESEMKKFLEALYTAYCKINKSDVVPLEEIYEILALRPDGSRDYEKIDFARDIYWLNSGDVKETRAGQKVSFPSSTALKNKKGVFSFVDCDGNPIPFAGIKFSGGR